MILKIPVAEPDIGELEEKYVLDALAKNEISSAGSYVKQFEDLFANKHEAKYGVACSSGTTALTLALTSLKIGEGDEVIVPDFTMIATAWAVSYLGAKPVFVDCDKKYCIDVDKIEEVITPKTKAIIATHIYGRRANMERILEIARDYNLWVIEDSCEAVSVPVSGDIACFSLYANKIVTAGEGGICITNNQKLDWQMRHLRGMAFSENHSFYHPKLAYNFRMTNLQAAVALAQTERLEQFLAQRRQIEMWYDEHLKGIQGITILPKRDVLWMYDILAERRDQLHEYLLKEGIETRVFFKPMRHQPMYRNLQADNFRAEQIAEAGMYLPTFTQITEEKIKFICRKIKDYYGQE